MKLIIIAALASNRVIGRNGDLPWNLPEDLAHFKQLTTGHAVLMGRKTYESMGAPLVNRKNVVLSAKPIPGVETYHSLNDALAALQGQENVFVIGGGRVFNDTLSLADELYLTTVEYDVEGDTFFPEYKALVEKDFTVVDTIHRPDLLFQHFVRRGK